MTHTYYVNSRYLEWTIRYFAGKEFRGVYRVTGECFAVVVEDWA